MQRAAYDLAATAAREIAWPVCAVERWLGFWLWDDEAEKRGAAEVFRTKGVLALRAHASRHFVQARSIGAPGSAAVSLAARYGRGCMP